MNLKIIIIPIIVVSLVTAGACYFFQKYVETITGPEVTIDHLEKEEPKTFGEKIYEMVQNPAEKIPQINPFKTRINPFAGLKINPFE